MTTVAGRGHPERDRVLGRPGPVGLDHPLPQGHRSSPVRRTSAGRSAWTAPASGEGTARASRRPEVDPVADQPDDVAVGLPGAEDHRLAPDQAAADRGHHPLGLGLGRQRVGGSTRSTTTGSSVWRSVLPHHQRPDMRGGRPVDRPAGVPGLVGADPAGLAGAGRHPQRGVAGRVVGKRRHRAGSPDRGATWRGRGSGHLHLPGPPQEPERARTTPTRRPPSRARPAVPG